jgi:DNA-binding MarR family transcriptional regulator
MTFVSSDPSEPGSRPPIARAAAHEAEGSPPTEDDGQAEGPTLTWDEVGFFLNAVTAAPRQWRAATMAIRDEFALKPRGPWILGLIHAGRVVFPSDLAKIFACSPGLITGELNRLIDAGLVATRKHEPDGRQLELTVTPLGETVSKRIGKALVAMVQDRLVGYTKDEVMFAARLLRDFAATAKP